MDAIVLESVHQGFCLWPKLAIDASVATKLLFSKLYQIASFFDFAPNIWASEHLLQNAGERALLFQDLLEK